MNLTYSCPSLSLVFQYPGAVEDLQAGVVENTSDIVRIGGDGLEDDHRLNL